MAQGSEIEGARKRLAIDSDCVLLVEGKDEVNVFNAMLRFLFGDESDIQVIDGGGKSKFPKRLQAIQIESQTRSTFRTLGIVRDADDNPQGAFQSVCHHIGDVGYDIPGSHGEFSNGSPSVGVFIVPTGTDCGAIETLCRQSVEGSAAAHCVDQYLDCLAAHDALASTNSDKTFAHAYLASTRHPVARVGEGALQGVWDFDSSAFEGLINFVRDLAN